MKKVLFISNIPAPYRIDFFNELGKFCDLTVLFEARRAAGIRFNWNEDQALHFQAIFLKDGEIDETHVNRQIFRYIKRGRYDRIVATSYGYYTETAALIAMICKGIPYDLEIDGGVVRPEENRLKRLLKRCILRNAKTLYSSGEATDRVYLHYGAKAERIRRYPFTSLHQKDLRLSVPTDGEKAAAKDALGLRADKLILGVGQFIQRKGFDVLLSAAKALDPAWQIALIGGEPPKEYRQLVAEQGLENVRFLNFLSKERLAEWYLAADVFVLPTREDMWGLVINEAMANALPVVTTLSCNAGIELVADGENGYLVPAEDGTALTDRICRILADPALQSRMAKASLQRIQPYTIEKMAQVHREGLNG